MVAFEYFQYDFIFDFSEFAFSASWYRKRQLMDTPNEILSKYLTKFVWASKKRYKI